MTKIAKEMLPESQDSHTSALESILGKQLVELSRCQYLFNNKPDNEDEGDVELKFKDGTTVTLFILSDGESVGAKSIPMEIPAPFDLDDDSHCSWKHLPLSTDEPWSKLVGVPVTKAVAIFDKYKKSNAEVLSGWKLIFDGIGYLCYFNCGDNGQLLFNRFPPIDQEVQSEERTIGNGI